MTYTFLFTHWNTHTKIAYLGTRSMIEDVSHNMGKDSTHNMVKETTNNSSPEKKNSMVFLCRNMQYWYMVHCRVIEEKYMWCDFITYHIYVNYSIMVILYDKYILFWCGKDVPCNNTIAILKCTHQEIFYLMLSTCIYYTWNMTTIIATSLMKTFRYKKYI